MFLPNLRRIARLILPLIARITTAGAERIPPTGSVIVVSNHVGRLDAFLAVILSERDDIILLVADKYRRYAFWRYFVRKLDAIWLNREELDLGALRATQKRLQAGGMLAMAPEGTRSKSGALIPGKPGAAYLAARTGALVVPVGAVGTRDREVAQRLRRFRRLDLRIQAGEPFRLPPMDRGRREVYLQAQTDEIMCRIAALLPPDYRGHYAGHERVRALLNDGPGPDAARPDAARQVPAERDSAEQGSAGTVSGPGGTLGADSPASRPASPGSAGSAD